MDLEEVEDTTAALMAAATDVSASTRASYRRRWRMWEAFADYHGVPALPAEPEHVAAFVVARHDAGVSPSGIAANLSSIGWFHGRSGDASADVCGPARVVLRALEQGQESAVCPAPVLSVGALVAMARATPVLGKTFAAKVVRSALGRVPPRQLLPLAAEHLRWGPAEAWVEVALPPVGQRGRYVALPAATARLVADPGWVACPVRALRQLSQSAGDGPLFTRGTAPYGSLVETSVRLGGLVPGAIHVGQHEPSRDVRESPPRSTSEPIRRDFRRTEDGLQHKATAPTPTSVRSAGNKNTSALTPGDICWWPSETARGQWVPIDGHYGVWSARRAVFDAGAP